MFYDFNNLINQNRPISEKTIYIEKILFDEYKLLERLGFCVNYSLISDLPNNDAVEACEYINKNKINEIDNIDILNFIKLNRNDLLIDK